MEPFIKDYIEFLESKLIYHNHLLRDLRIEFLQIYYEKYM